MECLRRLGSDFAAYYHDDESSGSFGFDTFDDAETLASLRRRAYRNICHGNKPIAKAMMMTAHQFTIYDLA